MIHRKRKIKKGESFKDIFVGTIAAFVIILFIGFLVFSNWRINQRRGELIKQAENLRREIQILEKRNEALKAGISQTESDEYWESKLYEQGYKKPGEEVVVVLPPKENEKGSETEKKGVWQKILEKLGF